LQILDSIEQKIEYRNVFYRTPSLFGVRKFMQFRIERYYNLIINYGKYDLIESAIEEENLFNKIDKSIVTLGRFEFLRNIGQHKFDVAFVHADIIDTIIKERKVDFIFEIILKKNHSFTTIYYFNSNTNFITIFDFFLNVPDYVVDIILIDYSSNLEQRDSFHTFFSLKGITIEYTEGKKRVEIFYKNENGEKVQIKRIYNRVIFDELNVRKDLQLDFSFEEELVLGTGSAAEGFGDSQKVVGLETCSTDEGTVDVGLHREIGRVVGLDAATVLDANLVGDRWRRKRSEEATDQGVHLLGLLRRRHLPRANRPHGFIGDDRLLQVVRRDAGERTPHLRGHHVAGAACLPLFECLANAHDRDQPRGKRGLCLGVDDCVGLAEQRPPFGVAEDHVAAAKVEEHRRGDLAGEGTARLVEHVLATEGHDRLRGRERHANRLDVDRRGAEHQFGRAGLRDPGCDGGGKLPGLRPVEVHLPVAGDDLPAGHAWTPNEVKRGPCEPPKRSGPSPGRQPTGAAAA
jgi:hypothetical protein